MAKNKKAIFGLTEGMRLDLFSEGQMFIFKGLLSKIDQDAIWIVNADGGDVPSVIHNSKVRLKGTFRDGGIIMLFGTICGSNARFWKVGQLSEHHFYNKRNYYRHPVSIETTAARLVDSSGEAGGTYRQAFAFASPCKVLNISGGGLMFYSNTKFFIDTDVQMGRIVLLPDVASFSLKCKVLRVTDNKRRYFCGCQFIDLTDKERERLIRAIFLLQVRDIRRRNY